MIPEEIWQPNKDVIGAFNCRGIPFAAGGGLAFSNYSCRLRATKDVDFYVTPDNKDRAIHALIESGYEDYFDRKGYDRSWIYRGCQNEIIVDIIWTAPNHRMQVDDIWIHGGPTVEVRGTEVPLLPAEEFLWSKLYVMQRDRCDWPDIMNVFYARGELLDWDRFITRLGPDIPLLGGVLSAYRWLAPERAAKIPSWVWEKVGLSRNWPETTSEWSADRVHLLDTRDWFGPKESID